MRGLSGGSEEVQGRDRKTDVRRRDFRGDSRGMKGGRDVVVEGGSGSNECVQF